MHIICRPSWTFFTNGGPRHGAVRNVGPKVNANHFFPPSWYPICVGGFEMVPALLIKSRTSQLSYPR